MPAKHNQKQKASYPNGRVVSGTIRIFDELSYEHSEAGRVVYGDTHHRAKLLKTIGGERDKWTSSRYWVRNESLTPDIVAQLTAPIYAEPDASLVLTRENRENVASFTGTHPTYGNVTVTIWDNRLVVTAREVTINRIALYYRIELKRGDDGVWVRDTNASSVYREGRHDAVSWAAFHAAIDQAATVAATLLELPDASQQGRRASIESALATLTLERARLTRELAEVQTKMDELQRQLSD